MSKRHKYAAAGTMLELWRPPRGAGDAIGCLATTYTFQPALFDEQCLARFLEIESEPNREDLAFLLEREASLGAVYAGVLVDHTQAGVEHSLRWDVLPVRIRGGKQHAKLSLLAWKKHVRIIVTSANVTEAGYRLNHEVALAVDATPDSSPSECLADAIDFLRCLLAFIPGAGLQVPEIVRAREFLQQVERNVADWKRARSSPAVRQHLVVTLPGSETNSAMGGDGFAPRSALEDAIGRCRQRGGSPAEAWIASPFFDFEADHDAATAALCKAMARGVKRRITFCVPNIGSPDDKPLRLAAPSSLMKTVEHYSGTISVELLPQSDPSRNTRPWHAKMLALISQSYSALLAGSSNFTRAGLGAGGNRNAEANILTIAERLPHAREPAELEAVWPEMKLVERPEQAEWLGPVADEEETEAAKSPPLPLGFLSARYRAGEHRCIVLSFDPALLPETWTIRTGESADAVIFESKRWRDAEQPPSIELPWTPVQPPVKLLVQWADGEAFWPLNVEDARQLPPPADLEHMTADDMLLILAASDPSAAFRAWAKKHQRGSTFDDELDAAIPVDLDPLQRYELHTTFLHRIRSRARVLAQLRLNLQRPVWSLQALQWRLEGFIGVKPLAERLMREVANANGQMNEAVLTLADFLVVLNEVRYEPIEGSLPKAKFDEHYYSFVRSLASTLDGQLQPHRDRLGSDLHGFWQRVVFQCQR